jgi:hypothetical protein
MDPALAPRRVGKTRVDFALLQRFFMLFGVVTILGSPFSPDPVAFAVCGATPWVIMRLVGLPTMPAAIPYFILWQWMQCFTRLLQSLIDGEALSKGDFGPEVETAFWYTLASTLTLAIAFRLVLGNLRPPTREFAEAHKEWATRDLMMIYIGSVIFSLICGYGARFVPSLDQPFEAASHAKILAMMMLFCTVLATGEGRNVMLAVFVLEVLSGFGGLFSDFKSVFIYLFIAALAVRVRLSGTAAFVGVVVVGLAIVLSLWWTAVKTDYREFATGSSDSQNIKTDLSSRVGFLGGKATGDIDWSSAAYALLIRLSYVDIFGSVIGVQEVAPEPRYFGQWQDALEHVGKPRFLFPGKPALSDTEVFIRLARGNASEAFRTGTSISVGYVAENFVDLGFPGMLAGIFAIGVAVAGICRYFMTRKLPWIMREGTVLAIIYTIGHDGVEISLPKILGATLMSFGVWAIMARWGFPLIFKYMNRSGRKQSGARPAPVAAGRLK